MAEELKPPNNNEKPPDPLAYAEELTNALLHIGTIVTDPKHQDFQNPQQIQILFESQQSARILLSDQGFGTQLEAIAQQNWRATTALFARAIAHKIEHVQRDNIHGYRPVPEIERAFYVEPLRFLSKEEKKEKPLDIDDIVQDIPYPYDDLLQTVHITDLFFHDLRLAKAREFTDKLLRGVSPKERAVFFQNLMNQLHRPEGEDRPRPI